MENVRSNKILQEKRLEILSCSKKKKNYVRNLINIKNK